jgi:hypothetical protein
MKTLLFHLPQISPMLDENNALFVGGLRRMKINLGRRLSPDMLEKRLMLRWQPRGATADDHHQGLRLHLLSPSAFDPPEPSIFFLLIPNAPYRWDRNWPCRCQSRDPLLPIRLFFPATKVACFTSVAHACDRCSYSCCSQHCAHGSGLMVKEDCKVLIHALDNYFM